MPEHATRLPRIRTDKKPEWADVIDKFYADSFDARTKEALLESAEAFSEMEPEEQAFHQAHIAFRQVQALEDVLGVLRRIEARLPEPKAFAALQHLPGIRKALVVIAKGQEEMLDLLEAGGPGGGRVAGDEEEEEDEDEDEDDEDQSDLSDAVDLDAVEEEDHGNGALEALVPEVLPAGSRRPAADASEVA